MIGNILNSQISREGISIVTIVNFIWFIIKSVGKFLLTVVSLAALAVIGINLFVILSTSSNVVDANEINQTMNDDVPILVLGAGVVNNEYPSQILANRLDKAYEIHLENPDNPLIMSGDHADQYYNEVGVMKQYLVDKGVPSEQIYLDHAGYSTHASLYRIKEVIGLDQVVIVTQGYHLPRALLLAKGLGCEALGVAAEEVNSTRFEREIREVFARLKDFGIVYLGYEDDQPEMNLGFSLEYSGDLTNIKEKLK